MENFDQEYKEWCEKNHRFIERYVEECVYTRARYCQVPSVHVRKPCCLEK